LVAKPLFILRDERSKLDGKFKQCIFLGYGRDDFGYRFWDLVDKKIVRSRDVVFLRTKPLKILKRKKSQNRLLMGSLILSLNLLPQLLIIGEI